MRRRLQRLEKIGTYMVTAAFKLGKSKHRLPEAFGLLDLGPA